MTDPRDKIEEQKQANVPDGDTRPDHQENTWRESESKSKKKLSKDRRADVNTLEDFRDAK